MKLLTHYFATRIYIIGSGATLPDGQSASGVRGHGVSVQAGRLRDRLC